MNDLIYVVAAYVVVLGGLVGYAIGLVRRTRQAERRLAAIEARRDRPAGGPDLVSPSVPPVDVLLR